MGPTCQLNKEIKIESSNNFLDALLNLKKKKLDSNAILFPL